VAVQAMMAEFTEAARAGVRFEEDLAAIARAKVIASAMMNGAAAAPHQSHICPAGNYPLPRMPCHGIRESTTACHCHDMICL
jgi:hypothetical protein